jgi:murein DD-endopeptidase MepM/ murein hydrolase activator NlpD
MPRRLLFLVLLTFVLSAGSPMAAGDRTNPVRARPSPSPAYRAPLVGPLVLFHAFAAPTSHYAAGERGVDLAVTPGTVVLAAGAGTVRFAGQVAGRGVVVIVHPAGITTEYEPLTPSVAVGQAVKAGDVIGVVSGVHVGCDPGTCLHWGARQGPEYFDPILLLEPLGVVRLLPWR